MSSAAATLTAFIAAADAVFATLKIFGWVIHWFRSGKGCADLLALILMAAKDPALRPYFERDAKGRELLQAVEANADNLAALAFKLDARTKEIRERVYVAAMKAESDKLIVKYLEEQRAEDQKMER